MNKVGKEEHARKEAVRLGMSPTHYARWKGAGSSITYIGWTSAGLFLVAAILASVLPSDSKGWVLAGFVGGTTIYAFINVLRVSRNQEEGTRPFDDFAMRNAIAAAVIILFIAVVSTSVFTDLSLSTFGQNVVEDLRSTVGVVLGAYFIASSAAEVAKSRQPTGIGRGESTPRASEPETGER